MTLETQRTNGTHRARSVHEIESDARSIRHEMSQTLRKLEDKFSPRDLVSQFTHGTYTLGSGSSDMIKNLGATARDNPVPLLLVATGIVALLASDRRRTAPGASFRGGGGGGEERERGALLAEKAKGFGQTAKELGESARGLTETAKERAQRLQGRAREGLVPFRINYSFLPNPRNMSVRRGQL